MVCRKTATEVTHSSDSPYFTNAAGPISHSPLPIESPRMIAPGPITPITPSPRVAAGRGRFASPHASSPDRSSRFTRRTIPRFPY